MVSMKEEKKLRLIIEGDALKVVDCTQDEVLCEFTSDELAEIIQFRYATPWNKSKDIMEKLTYILDDILNAYVNSEDIPLKKEDIMKRVKFRVHSQTEE
ncbi:hypothetical protein [Thermococcus sp.]|uniref:hypothetical protein n=1 Tax=Thermococcus sp. TaxID=35749 RepID=UPI002615D7F5|nr:hypothetical protein [Thermococcus sp.]